MEEINMAQILAFAGVVLGLTVFAMFRDKYEHSADKRERRMHDERQLPLYEENREHDEEKKHAYAG